MTESEWVEHLVSSLVSVLPSNCEACIGKRLAYGLEAMHYVGQEPTEHIQLYQTDVLIIEHGARDTWTPRVVIEAKLAKITTHDAITYSQKAAAHKAVQPYLRYGIMLGNRRHYPLPGRLFRHGAHFDFMYSSVGVQPTRAELTRFATLLNDELEASRTLEHILYNSRKANRDRYSLLHRHLVME